VTFTSEGRIELLQKLLERTRQGKIDWQEIQDVPWLTGSSIARLAAGIGKGTLEATVGGNHFKLGSRDFDMQAPFFLEVNRRSGDSNVRDLIGGGVDSYAAIDHDYRVTHLLTELGEAAHAHAAAQAEVVNDIIADLDNL
jgi:hypothetical protein